MDDSHDPLAFTPVPTDRARHDGWTADRQLKFIEALRVSGVVRTAAEAAGMSRKLAYALRSRPGAESFAKAWDEALVQGRDRVFEFVMDRALNGVVTPRYYKGKVVGSRHRFDYRGVIAALTPPPAPKLAD